MSTTESHNGICLVAGMPRAGTTWAFQNLSQHPEILSSYKKELSFFSMHFDRGFDWYTRQFPTPNNLQKIKLDCSPEYFFHPNFVANLGKSELILDIIVFIRDRNSWLDSLYRQMKQFDLKIGSFDSFCELYTFRNYNEPFTISLNNFTEFS